MTALVLIAAVIAACSSPAGTSGEESPPGSEASEPAATAGSGAGGGSGDAGGGGRGANGSITYEMSGDVDQSGELPFVYLGGGASAFANGGWVAYFFSDETPDVVIQINSNPDSNVVNYGDGEVLVVGTEDSGCTFDYSTNDESGLVGTIDCPSTLASSATGELLTVEFHARVDAHT